ncbi:serum response factor-like isoform X2 [Engraulis encrasicolus]|uniref:serum response factor-like isoform X2 n=1 Tax=Engraulis encrasicolus TaxID=184585 RepID=UPI002FD08F1A
MAAEAATDDVLLSSDGGDSDSGDDEDAMVGGLPASGSGSAGDRRGVKRERAEMELGAASSSSLASMALTTRSGYHGATAGTHTATGAKPGKKTRGRVKIKMEFIDNKLRRYTTFSKRKTGIMKKAYELSTLTGTQVLLLVASETGHVYTFATRKLQPMITSETGKALIQTCLNSPDSPPPRSGVNADPCSEQRMSATGFEETELSYQVTEATQDGNAPEKTSTPPSSSSPSSSSSPPPPPPLSSSSSSTPSSAVAAAPPSWPGLALHPSNITTVLKSTNAHSAHANIHALTSAHTNTHTFTLTSVNANAHTLTNSNAVTHALANVNAHAFTNVSASAHAQPLVVAATNASANPTPTSSANTTGVVLPPGFTIMTGMPLPPGAHTIPFGHALPAHHTITLQPASSSMVPTSGTVVSLAPSGAVVPTSLAPAGVASLSQPTAMVSGVLPLSASMAPSAAVMVPASAASLLPAGAVLSSSSVVPASGVVSGSLAPPTATAVMVPACSSTAAAALLSSSSSTPTSSSVVPVSVSVSAVPGVLSGSLPPPAAVVVSSAVGTNGAGVPQVLQLQSSSAPHGGAVATHTTDSTNAASGNTNVSHAGATIITSSSSSVGAGSAGHMVYPSPHTLMYATPTQALSQSQEPGAVPQMFFTGPQGSVQIPVSVPLHSMLIGQQQQGGGATNLTELRVVTLDQAKAD